MPALNYVAARRGRRGASAAALPSSSLRAWLVLVMLVAAVPLALLLAWQLFD